MARVWRLKNCEEVTVRARCFITCKEVLRQSAILQYIARKYQAGAAVVVKRGPGGWTQNMYLFSGGGFS
eukprot:2552465-Pyramimonas_sp.AAC.1